MNRRDLTELLLLAAIWGASFPFIRHATPEFGPVVVAALRVAIATLFLLPLLQLRGLSGQLRNHWRPLLVVGLLNSALPFSLLAYASQFVTAGFASILNATTPLWAALVAHFWLHDRLHARRIIGLGVGFAGVLILIAGKGAALSGGTFAAIAAALAATLSYGVSASFTKKHLAGVNPLLTAGGSQFAAALLLAPLAAVTWPPGTPGTGAWLDVLVLGVLCTGVAYILYFRLIAHIGPPRAVAVTYLIPVFGMLWGGLFLGETVTVTMLAGGAVIALGTALVSGRAPAPARPAAAE